MEEIQEEVKSDSKDITKEYMRAFETMRQTLRGISSVSVLNCTGSMAKNMKVLATRVVAQIDDEMNKLKETLEKK